MCPVLFYTIYRNIRAAAAGSIYAAPTLLSGKSFRRRNNPPKKASREFLSACFFGRIYSTIKVQVAAGRTNSPAAAAAGEISGRVLPSPRTSGLPLHSIVPARRLSAES